MKTKKLTEQDLFDMGYDYIGEIGNETHEHEPNQIWRRNGEEVVYNPEEEELLIWWSIANRLSLGF